MINEREVDACKDGIICLNTFNLLLKIKNPRLDSGNMIHGLKNMKIWMKILRKWKILKRINPNL